MKRFLCAMMCVMLLSGILCAAQAENITAYAKGSLKVYKDANTTSDVLGTLGTNDVITVIAVNGGWCRIKNAKGAIGYCQKSGLEKLWTGSAKGYVIAETLPIFASPDTTSTRLGVAHCGDVLTVNAASGEWCRVRNQNGEAGFCKASGLSKTNPDLKQCWITYGGKVVIYSDTNMSKQVGTASFGQSYTLVGTSGKWAWLKNAGGANGYVMTDVLSLKNPCNMQKTVYTQVAGNLLYSWKNGEVMSNYLPKNTVLTLLGAAKEGTWCIVEYRGAKYYVMHASLLSESKATEDTIRKVTIEGDLYKTNSHSGTSRKLEVGEEVRLLEYTSKGSCKVQTKDGTIGYVMGWLF